jgi:hypothetical protein
MIRILATVLFWLVFCSFIAVSGGEMYRLDQQARTDRAVINQQAQAITEVKDVLATVNDQLKTLRRR